MTDFPSNSRVPRPPASPAVPASSAPKPPKIEETVKLESVVSGPAIKRKKPLGRRMREIFLSGDSTTNVAAYIVRDVLVPAVQNLVTDMVIQGVERAVYGEVRSTPGRTAVGRPGVRPAHVTYNRPASPAMTYSSPAAVRRPITQPDAQHFDEVVVPTLNDAQRIIDGLWSTCQQYECASVANLYELAGQTPEWTDGKYGWRNLDDLTARRVRNGYLIVVPPVVDLDK